MRLSNNIDKGWSNIDVVLKQRHEELPKLVEVCNGYMTHERQTLEAVTQARSAYGRSLTIEDKARAENHVTSALDVVRHRRTVSRLESESGLPPCATADSVLENTIADRREFYNDSVNVYNITIEQIPANWVAQQSGYRAKPLLEVPNAERQDVRLDFANRPPRARAAIGH